MDALLVGIDVGCRKHRVAIGIFKGQVLQSCISQAIELLMRSLMLLKAVHLQLEFT